MTERIPILQIASNLVVSIQTELHDRLAISLQEDITSRLASGDAEGVLIDVSLADVIDTFVGRVLINVALSARLLGAETVVVGMRPQVAMTLVDLGMDLEGVRTALDLDRGISLLQKLHDRARG